MQVNLVLKADIYGDLSVVQATPSKALKLALEDASYQKRLTLISQKADAIMARDHWDQGIKPAYVAQVRSKMKKTSLTQLDKVLRDIDQESKEVGSDTYTAFFQASQLPNHDKLNLVMEHMQVYVDKYQFLQLGKSGYKFSKKLEPTSPFYSYFREAIMETYQTDLGLGVDDLGIKLHLFRSWIDKQSMDYIRTNYKGKTDLDKLLAYSKDKKIHLDYTTGASYHNRSLGDFTYPQNMKIQLPQTSVMGHTELAIPVLLSLLSIWIRGDLSLSGMSTRKGKTGASTLILSITRLKTVLTLPIRILLIMGCLRA